MPKAYWVVHIDVTEPKAYDAYRAANGTAFAKYGARFLVRGADQDVREGAPRARCVVIEFDDLATARACYDSPEYQSALALRRNAAVEDFIIIEGYDGPQPIRS